MFIGSLVAGWLNQMYTTGEDEEAVTNWRMFWAIPCVVVAIAAALFWFSL